VEVILRLIVLKDFFKWSFQKEEPASSLAGRLLLDEVEGGIITLCWLLSTSVRKVDGFALVFLICLAALVLHR